MLNLLNPIGTAQAAEEPAEPSGRRGAEPAESTKLQPGDVLRIQRFDAAWKALEEVNPRSGAFAFLRAPGALPSEAEIAQLEAAVKDEYIKRTCDFPDPMASRSASGGRHHKYGPWEAGSQQLNRITII